MQIRPAISSALVGLLLFAPAAFAADGEDTPLNLEKGDASAAQSAGSTGGGLVRTIVGLAVVIAVIYGLYWVLKQVKASREERASGSGLTPVATLPLGGNRSLQLVRAGQEIVMVGVSEHGVTPIRTYAEAEARELGLLTDEAEAPPTRDEPVAGGGRSVLDRLRERTVIR
jgi:flagellar protein FliO/FliZ